MSIRKQRKSDEPLEMGGVLLHAGSRIGNYVFLREIGSGGMARVLLAKDPAGNLVALKVLRKSRFKTGLVRFRREFRALSRINHPNVIRVEAYGDLYGHPYIAMEYVDGPDLHSTIRGFRGWEPERRWQRCEEILVDLCRALAAVHRRGLVHRDLKPSNVLLTRSDGVCKLTDFGIVKDLDPTHDPHQSTTLVGTWAYASPEQISGSPIDHRSDLYSLGVILFAMLTGKRPFVANDMAGYLALHRDRPAPAPRDVNRDIPAVFDEICRRLLQKSPRDRYQSAQEILYRLEKEERPALAVVTDAWEPPLVGRDLEQEVLTDAVAALTDRRGGVIVLEGDDGSGRSRLLEVAASRARDLGIAHHRLEFQHDGPVFQSVIKLDRALSQELDTRAPAELRGALQGFNRDVPVRGDARFALYDGTREGLRVALEDRPWMLLLDDLHEAHPREIDLLAYLVRTLLAQGGLPLLVVATLRPKANAAADAFSDGEQMGWTPRGMTVGPLSKQDVGDMIYGLVGDSKGARMLAQRLHNETEGNAYFVTEFLRALLAHGVIAQDGGGHRLTLGTEEIATGHLEIPLGVRQMMKNRLEGVAQDDRRVLEVLAVGGREVDLDVLLDVLDDDEEKVLDSLDRLLAAGIVRERRAADAVLHSVTHRKFADVVYRYLHPDRRASLHRRMAAALELHYSQNPAALEVVGEHYRRSGDAGRAYRYLVAAAKRLVDRSLAQEAWELTEKAGALEESALVDLTDDDYRAFRRDCLGVRASVLYNRADWAEAEKTWRTVLQMADEDGDLRGACRAALELATVLRRRGRTRESRRYAERALEQARRLHYREGVADALHCLAALAWTDTDLDECERMASEGLLVAQGTDLADRRAELLLALTSAQATKGHLASATSGLTEAEGIFRELRKKRPRCLALCNLSELLTWQGEPLQARQRAHVAVEIAEELDYKLGLTAATRATAVAAADLGLYDEARRELDLALRLAEAIDLPEEMMAVFAGLMQLDVEEQDWESARHHAPAALAAAERRDPERYLPLVRAHLARAMAASGQGDARTMAMAAEQALDSLPIPRRTQVMLALAWAWLEMDEVEEAHRYARTVLHTAGSRGFKLWALEARALMTWLSDGEEAALHRSVGQELARDFTGSLSGELARAFMHRPFLKYLDDPE